MTNPLTLSVSPHIHSGRSTARIMLDVIIALIPAVLAGTFLFGLRALLVIGVTVVAAVVFEVLFHRIAKKEQTVGDFSAILTGLLLALNLPVNIALWQCVIGAFFAIVVVKCLFGGLGCNVVNPAITARVFMLVSFGSMAVVPSPALPDAVSGATLLSVPAEGEAPNLLQLFFGLHGGAIGETCSVALILGFVYLIARRVITWHIPVTTVATVFLASFFGGGMDVEMALSLTLSGGLLLGAIFMATDYVTSPVTPLGRVLFGVGIGLITFLIRSFSIYPEGVSFAILLMNILTPYIDSWTRRKVFGVGGKAA